MSSLFSTRTFFDVLHPHYHSVRLAYRVEYGALARVRAILTGASRVRPGLQIQHLQANQDMLSRTGEHITTYLVTCPLVVVLQLPRKDPRKALLGFGHVACYYQFSACLSVTVAVAHMLQFESSSILEADACWRCCRIPDFAMVPPELEIEAWMFFWRRPFGASDPKLLC